MVNKLVLTRYEIHATCIIGELKAIDKQNNILFRCYTLEEDKEGIERDNDLRVPADVYNLKRHISSSFNAKGKAGKIIVLKNDDSVINIYNDKVAFDRHILIHWGNTHIDTKGCILLGLTKSLESIGDSRNACKKFYDLMYGLDLNDIKLEIINKF